jgi:TolB-like protein
MSLPRGFSVESVRLQLDRLLASSTLSRARKLQDLLSYLVENRLNGAEDQIKEYILGTEVFGRSDLYDPRTDPIVRVQVRRLREKLADYYQAEGQSDPILIKIPKGSYTATVTKRAGRTVSPRLHLPKSSSGVVIAVLPFVVFGCDLDHEHLGDELTEWVIDTLAADNMRVVCRTSVYQYRNRTEDVREIGKHLNANQVLEGSVRVFENHLRVKIRLVSALNGFTLGSQTFHMPHMTELLDQPGVASAVLNSLKPMLKRNQKQSQLRSHLPDLEKSHESPFEFEEVTH